MSPKLLLCLALILSGVLTGCETDNVEKNHFTVTNLNSDGRTETYTNSFANGSRGLVDGKMLAFFQLNNPSCSLVLYYPTNKLNQISEWQVDSRQTYAWLARTQLDGQIWESIKSSSSLPFPNSEPLRGRIQAGEFDWRHKNRHYLAFDLTGDTGFAIKGELNSYDRTKFDAKQLWLDPYLIVFGPFVKW